jgi:4-aminobutyrate aminotransferase-like enzyme
MMHSAKGNVVFDKEENAWLDMLSGILNVSLGHKSDVVTGALTEVFLTGLINTYDRQAESSFKLTNLLHEYDPRFHWKLLNTGAEAIERAIQIASIRLDKLPQVAVLEGSFHGKSLSMSCGRYDVPWGNPINIIVLDDDYSNWPHFDVLIYEPITGWNGTVADEKILRLACDERNALLIADEMITGFLRCGKRFLNTTANMVVAGKGLAQGVPLTVLGMRSNLASLPLPIGWNTTCGGNNLCSTIGFRVLKNLIANEDAYTKSVLTIENALTKMGFKAWGAFGFKKLTNDPKKAREVFERNRIIVSWHNEFIRIGPSFITNEYQLDMLSVTLKEAEMAI